MKVITRCVIDIDSGQVVEEESFDYQGPLALCDFGGASYNADNSAQAAREAAAMQMAMYQQTRKDMGPYREVGERTTPYYGGILGIPGYEQVDPTQALRSTPGYNWMMDQGTEAIERKAAGRGLLGAGATAKGLMSYGQGLADQTYNNYMNRLYNLVGTGQNASAQTGQFGANAATQAGNALMQGAAAQDKAEWMNAQQPSGWNQMLGGLGLLGGLALTPVTGGLSNSLAGRAFGWS